MAKKFDAGSLDFLRKTQEVGIRTGKRPDHRRDHLGGRRRRYRHSSARCAVRPASGTTISADGRATIEINDRLVPVRAIAVSDAPTIEAVSAEYLRKYAASPYAQAMVKPETLPTTLRIEPE